MTDQRHSVTILTLLLLTGLATLPRTQAQASGPAFGATGTVWGGQHVELEVTPEGAMLEFDCASGSISKPVQLDAKGNFKVSGSFTRERPGPVMRDGPPPAAATYSGSIQGGSMKMTITGGEGESLGEYVLVQGKSGRVMKCK